MQLSGPSAHLACVVLLALDFVARTWRTQLFLGGLGHRLPFREVFVQSAIGETASSLTPLRAGGEPARIWTMTHQGVPARVAVVSVGVEFVATSVVIVLAGLLLGLAAGGEWWATAGPNLVRSAVRGWPWLLAIALVMAAAWVLLERVRPDLLHEAREELAHARGHLRDIPLRVYAVTVPVSVLNIGARVAILPVLAQTLAHPPPLAATLVGSFVLLYAQAIIPTPAGTGAVEFGFLGGAAGNLGAAESSLLGWWRFYTTIAGTVLGVVLAVWRFHANVLPLVLRRQRTPSPTDDDAATGGP